MPDAPTAPAPAPARTTRPHWWHWLALLPVYVGLLPLYKLWPGQMPTLPISLLEFGSSACLAQQPWSTLTCPTIGMPRGLVVAFGLPVIWLAALLQRLGGWDVATAYRIAEALLVLVALLAATRFFRLFTDARPMQQPSGFWLALFVAALYLMAPNVSREDVHGALRMGFALVPAYLLADVFYARAVRDGASLPRLALGWWGLVLLRTFALFCDGYSFVMALLVAGLLWAFTLLPMLLHGPRRRALLGALLALASVVLPVLLYRLYVAESQYPTMPLDFFRGQGIDAYFFVVPAVSLWLPTLLGLAVDVPGPVVHSVGPSSHLVYLGYALFAGGALAAWRLWRRDLRAGPLGLALTVGGLAALLLSLGPEFKWMNFDWNASREITFQTYLMRAGEGRFALPTAWLYEHVPGIEIMRALYRWVLLPRLALLAALATGLAWLLARGTWPSRLAAAVLGLLALAESLPNLPAQLERGATNARIYAATQAGPVAGLRALTQPGERAVFMPLHDRPSRNPYLANLLCAEAALRCYDVGGDKSRRISADVWPEPIAAIAEGEQSLRAARRALASRLVDVVIVPFFDLRWNAGTWPPDPRLRAEALAALRPLQSQPSGVAITTSPDYALLRRQPGAAIDPTPTAPVPSGHMPRTQGVVITAWGPHTLARGTDDVYLWLRPQITPAHARLLLGDWPLLTYHKPDGTLAAWVREVDWAHFRRGEQAPLILLDEDSGTRQVIGQVQIAPSGD